MSAAMEISAREAAPLGSSPAGDAQLDANVEAGRQFVTFRMEEEVFGVPLTEVQEIIRLPPIVEVPLASNNLKGLANLRGAVLPIMSLRRVFGMSETASDDSTRVVVMNAGTPIGYIVDRMDRVISADAGDVESVDRIRATVDTELLSGVVKRSDGMVMILDTTKLLQSKDAHVAKKDRRFNECDGSEERSAAAQVVDELQLVSFEVDGQEYALPIESVEEIVQVPEQIRTIPNSREHLLGVINLRNRMLPLVSLRSLFGLPPPAAGHQSRIVIVSRKIDGVAYSVGLVTDSVKEVLRAPRSAVDPIPRLMASRSGQNEVESICRLDGGKRLVSIMVPDRLFLNADVRSSLEAAGAGKDAEMTGEQNKRDERVDDEEQFVIFRLADEEYGVPIDSVREIVRVPEQITKLPKAPHFVEGVINLRGSVMPIVDQRRRFSLANIERNDRQRIMVFTIRGAPTGFIVDSVSEVLKISRSRISQAPDLAANEDGAVARVANLVDSKRLILMLDVEKLLSESELAALRNTQ